MTTDIKERLRTLSMAMDKIGADSSSRLYEEAASRIEQLEGQLSAQTAKPEICTGCNGRGEVGGLTMEGYQSEPCPYCKTEQPSLSDAEIVITLAEYGIGLMSHTSDVEPFPLDGDDAPIFIAAYRALLAQRQDSDKDAGK